MKCQYHEGQVKTHICLKGLCKHAVLCPICIAKDHQNHMTIELLQFKRSVANLILQHDNPEPLDTLSELTLQIAKFDQILQESLKLLYQKRKETIEFDHFKQVEGILQVEHPTNSQQMALKKVGQHMLFYKDQSNQWTFQLVADNQEYKIWDKLIQDLRSQVKQQTNQLSKILDQLQQIYKLIDSEVKQKKIIINTNISNPQNDGFNNISKKIKAEGRERDTQQEQDEFFKAEQQQSIRLLRILENNSDSEDSEPKIIHQIQQQIPNSQSQTTQQLQQQQQPFLFAQPDRKYVSVTEQFKDSDIAKQGQVREKRKYVKKADKLAMMGQKRIYRRKTYDRFKFNTNQCIAVFKEMLD